jgi:hypothetical protein
MSSFSSPFTPSLMLILFLAAILSLRVLRLLLVLLSEGSKLIAVNKQFAFLGVIGNLN